MSEKDLTPEPMDVDTVDPKPDAAPAVPKPKPAKIAVPVKVDIQAVYDALPAPAGPAVVGNGEVDDVLLSACIPNNIYARKSLTIHHLQRRLVELGFEIAGRDKDGFYGNYTKAAIAQFQDANGLAVTDVIDAATFLAVFKGDPNVKPIV